MKHVLLLALSVGLMVSILGCNMDQPFNADADGFLAGIITFDPDCSLTASNSSGACGFVGKGDVQYTLNWNNKQLQDGANGLLFRSTAMTVKETSWECTNSNNDKIQERERSTTTVTQGLLSEVARDNSNGKNGPITGFKLTGFNGAPTITTSSDGPPLNSCPSGPWSLTSPAGDPVIVSQSSGLEVSSNGGDFIPLLEKPLSLP